MIEKIVYFYNTIPDDASTYHKMDMLLSYMERFEEITIRHINPEMRNISGKNNSTWDFICYVDKYPEHHFNNKNPRPLFFIDGWEPENEEE
jgi:hypothetical protein